MGNKLDKNTLILCIIGAVSLITGVFLNMKFALVLFILLLLLYLFISKRYMIDVFKGIKAYNLEDYEKAIELYRDAAMSPWCNSTIITNYLICELKHGKPSLAKEYVTENLKLDRFKKLQLLNLKITKSIVLWKNDCSEEAITLLKDLAVNCKNTYLFETLTSLLLGSKKFVEAKKYIDEAMEFNSSSAITRSNYAEINYKLDNFDESKKVFDELIEENIKFVEPYYYCALMESNAGNFQKAIDYLHTAEGLNESLVSLISHKDIQQALNTIMVKSLNSAD